MTFLREPLQVVEIVQPLCSRTFGTAPCLATGTKCWNTRATCKYLAALDLTQALSLFFVKPNANRPSATGFDPATAIPSLRSVDTAPTVLNVASGDSDFSPLGLRAVASIVIDDHPYNDAGIDPYLSSRAYSVETRGTFWGRWLARNPYHVGYAVRVYDGFVGDALSAMIKREYFVDNINRGAESVRISAKDILRKITDTDHKSPAASPGVLALAITDVQTSLTVAGAVVGDYPAPGRVRIGSEVIGYATATSGGSSVVLGTLVRGDLNTVAASHGQNSGVQWVLSYEAVRCEAIIYDLIVTRAGVPAAYVDNVAWAAEATKWRPLYIFTRHITVPTSTHKLVGEVVQQSQSHIWWDERLQEVRFEAQRPNFNPNTLTETDHIIADSFSINEDIKDRASTVYVYYDLRNPTLSTTDAVNYTTGEVLIDADSADAHGEQATKVIFAPWITSAALARSLATKYVHRFKNARRSIAFEVTADSIAGNWTGDAVLVSHWQDQLSDGSTALRAWLITSAETVEQGARYKLTAEDNESAGVYWEWVATAGSPADWWAATPAERAVIGFWCDANGNDPGGNPSPFRWI